MNIKSLALMALLFVSPVALADNALPSSTDLQLKYDTYQVTTAFDPGTPLSDPRWSDIGQKLLTAQLDDVKRWIMVLAPQCQNVKVSSFFDSKDKKERADCNYMLRMLFQELSQKQDAQACADGASFDLSCAKATVMNEESGTTMDEHKRSGMDAQTLQSLVTEVLEMHNKK